MQWKEKCKDTLLLLVRLWLGFIMIEGGQSILRFFSSQELRDFFTNWFGNELGYPAPLLMAFLAKSTEFVGGILVAIGLFTRISAGLIAFVMLMATVTANLGEDFRPDGVVTVSCCLFACSLVMTGAGRISLDKLVFRKQRMLI